MDLAPISSLQCVDTLWRLGLKIEDANDVRVRLVRSNGRRIVVPRHKTLEPAALRVILMAAGIEEPAFYETLHRRPKSGELQESERVSTGVRARNAVELMCLKGQTG